MTSDDQSQQQQDQPQEQQQKKQVNKEELLRRMPKSWQLLRQIYRKSTGVSNEEKN